MSEQKRILVVEDSPTQALQVQYLLENAGYAVGVAYNGREGLEKARADKPDLIIADVIMPEMDGYEMCAALKADAPTRDIPIILLTAKNQPLDIIRGLKVGADNFVPKPYDDNFLLTRVRAFFSTLSLFGSKKFRVELHLELFGQSVTVTPENQQIVELLLETMEALADAYRSKSEEQQELHTSLEQVRWLNHELDTLRKLAEIAVTTLTVTEALDQSLASVLEALALDKGLVLLPAAETDDLILAAQRGLPREVAQFAARVSKEEAIISQALATGSPVLIRDVGADDRVPAVLRQQTDFGAAVCVPLRAREETMGFLGVFSPRGRRFTAQDLEFLNACGLQIGLVANRVLLYQETQRLAITDGLTGLVNHRRFYERLLAELARSNRYVHSTAVILLDLDDFKAYNDTHGHLAGDYVLRHTAAQIRKMIREVDTAARYGGEEFAVILPEANKASALIVAERIRQALVECDAKFLSPVTMSVGVALCPEDGTTAELLVHAADKALYQAKQSGKNRVIAASEIPVRHAEQEAQA